MCGIAGILQHYNGEVSLKEKSLHQVNVFLNTQAFRGPDYQNIEMILQKNLLLTLGHNRLSIVDLKAISNQPMWDEEKRYCIAYNGMVYNYVELRSQLIKAGYTFFSQGDTEVVLKAFMHWGNEAFHLFNGMFAIALYDKLQEKLYLIRDRFGIKPLYYCKMNQAIYFASTSQGLAAELTLQPNLTNLANGLHYWCYENDHLSLYHDLFLVPPCTILTFQYKDATWHIDRNIYYDLKNKVQHTANTSNLTTMTEEMTHILQDAINLRLRADVPIGISLSGGLDSSVIGALAKKNLIAFTYGSLDQSYTEAKAATLSAKHSDLNLKYIFPADNTLQKGFWDTLKVQDAPFPNFSIVAQYFIFQAAQKHGIKVMLGGQGSDEIFMGYRKFFFFYIKQLMHEKKYKTLCKFLISLTPTFLSEFSQLPHYCKNLARYHSKRSSIHDRWQPFILPLDLKAEYNLPLWYRQYDDIYKFSLPTLLRYEDRNSMGNSIESRLPFLDYRLVELALALPTPLKLNKGFGKWFLREITRPWVPDSIYNSRIKRGFDVNTKIWLQSGVGNSIRASLKDNAKLLKLFNLTNKVDTEFRDSSLLAHPRKLAEVISLVWLASKPYFEF